MIVYNRTCVPTSASKLLACNQQPVAHLCANLRPDGSEEGLVEAHGKRRWKCKVCGVGRELVKPRVLDAMFGFGPPAVRGQSQ